MKDQTAKRRKLEQLERAEAVVPGAKDNPETGVLPMAMTALPVVPKEWGLYAIECKDVPGYAYVGKAGPRQDGLRGRLRSHLRQGDDSLVKPLEREVKERGLTGYRPKDRDSRQSFYTDQDCKFRWVTVDKNEWSGSDVRELETAAIEQYCPKWNDERRKPKSCSFQSVLTPEATNDPAASETCCGDKSGPSPLAMLLLVVASAVAAFALVQWWRGRAGSQQ